MAASPYGLSIVLDFEDNASEGMNNAAGAFSNLSGSADALTMGIGGLGNSLLNMNTSVVGMSVMGSQLQNMGQGMLGTLGSVANKVVDTSSTFENFGITLKALYGSEEEAQNQIGKLFDFAKHSPFEVEDLSGMVVTLKSQGLEAFDEITSAASGAHQTTMEWIGDLQSFRPEATATQWKLAIQNFLSGSDSVSAKRLRNILDVGELSQFIGHDLGKTVEERMQSLTDIVEKLGITGLMKEMEGTWSITLSNMDDVWSQFAYRIGFGNKDNNLYKSAVQTMQNLLSVETDFLNNQDIINATTDAFNGLVSPFLTLSKAAMNMTPVVSEWLGKHPQLIKWATGLTAVGGAGMYATGSLLKLSAGALNWILNVQRLGGLSGIMGFLTNTITALSTRMIGIGAVAGLGFLLWQKNFLGVRDAVTSLGKQVGEVFSTTMQDLQEGKSLTHSLAQQGLSEFGAGLRLLRKTGEEAVQSLYGGFATFFNMFGMNLRSLNEQTFSFKGMLNGIGDSIIQRFGGKNIDTFQQKYGHMLSTVGTLGASFLSATAASTVFAGAIRFLNGTSARLLTNFRLIGSTLMSPTGLLGMGLTLFTLGYTRNFLGLQELTHKIVDGLKSGMKELQGAGKITAGIFGGGKDGTKLAERYGLQEFETGLYRVRKTALSFGASIIQGMKNSGTGIGKILTEMFPDNVDLSIQGILNSIGRLGSKVAEFFGLDLGTGSISEKFEVLGQKIGGVITKAALLLPAFKGFQTLMQNNINPLALTGILKGLSMIREGASTTFNALKTGFSGVVNSITSGISSFRRFWGDIFHDFMQSGRGIFGGGEGLLGNFMGRFRGNALNELSILVEMLREDFADLTDVVSHSWNGLWNRLGIDAGAEDIAHFLADRSELLSGFFEDVFAGFSAFAENHSAEITSAVSGMASQLGTNVVGAIASIAASIQMVKWQVMFGALTSGVQMFMGALGGAIQMVMGLNVAAVGLAALSSAVLTFGTLTTSQWSELSAKIKEQPTLLGKAGAAWTWFNERLAGTVTKVNDFFAKFDISGGVSKVLDFVSNLGSSFASIIGGSRGNNGLADFGGRLISQFVKGLANGAKGLGSSLQQIITSVTSSIQTYAPQIGSSLGQLIGRAFQFVGRNAPAIIESAFTIMESFVKGLWENRDAIMDGAFRIIDALCQGIITHGPEIIGYVGQLVDYFVQGLEGRDGELSAAANALIDPIMNIIESNGPRLWGLAKSVFGHLFNILLEEVTRGVANILRAVAQGAQVVALLLGGLAVATAFIPGLQPLSAGLGFAAGQMEGLALLAGGGAIALDGFADGLDKTNKLTTDWNSNLGKLQGSLAQSVDHSGNFVRTTSGAIKELDGDIESLSKKQSLLKDMWAKGETVHKIKITEEGSEEVQYKIQQIAKDDGTFEYKLVAIEDDPSGKSLVDENKTYAENNPMKQKLEVESEGENPEDYPDVKKDWWTGEYKPDYSNIDMGGYSPEEISNNKNRVDEEARRANALKNFASDYNAKLFSSRGLANPMEEGLDFTFNKWGGRYADFVSELGHITQNKWKDTWSNMPTDMQNKYKDDVKSQYQSLMDVQKGIQEVINQKPDSFTWTDQLVDTYQKLTSIDLSQLLSNSSSPQEFMKNLTDINYWYTDFKSQLEAQGITIKINPETNEVEFVKEEVEELNDSEAKPKVEAEGAEKTKSDLDGVKDKVDEVNGTEAKANVSQDGAEETKTAAEETKTAVEEIPEEKKVTIETNTSDGGASVDQVAEAVKDFPTEDKTVHIHVVTDLMALGVISGIKNAMKDIPEEKTSTLTVSVTEGVAEQVQSLKTSIEELPAEKTIPVQEQGASESKERVDALHTSIEALKDKTVSVTANVYGKEAVDALASSIAAVHSKEVTITAKSEKKGGFGGLFGGDFAEGGVIPQSDFQRINEKGGEIVDLPAGSRVYPHDESVAMSYQDGYNAAIDSTQQMIASSPTAGGSASSAKTPKTTPTSNNHYDYSVHLGEGAIQLRVDNANGEADYKAAAEKMMKYIMEMQKRNQMARR